MRQPDLRGIKMTPYELLKDLDECTGPCGRMCLSCPESRYVAEIMEVLENLIHENEILRSTIVANEGMAISSKY